MKKTYHFKTHSELKNVIGQDLINDDNIAIIELIKNSMDAGSGSIYIEFIGDSKNLVVYDNGSGMSLDDLENKWLNIAYSEKKNATKNGKFLAGNKGVGRFACDRLGRRLDIFTRKSGDNIYHLKIKWSSFENKYGVDESIQTINVNIQAISERGVKKLTNKVMPLSGTILYISQLRKEWHREQLLVLKKQLQNFVNPIDVFSNEALKLELIASHEKDKDATQPVDLLRVNGVIENKIFENLKFKTTYVTTKIKDNYVHTELWHDGERVYELVETNSDFPSLEQVTLTLHYMNPYKKAYFKRQTGLHVVEFGSVFLFVNGYRVPPYGERDNDWLGINSRRAQGHSRSLGNRDLLGVISVHDHHGLFRIVSNREGIAKNYAFEELTKSFFMQQYLRLEKFVIDGLDWDRVSADARNNLLAGVIPKEEDEQYLLSSSTKSRNFLLDMMKITGADPKKTIHFNISEKVLNSIKNEKNEKINQILEKFKNFNENVIGHDIKIALKKINEEFLAQQNKLESAQRVLARKERHVSNLVDVARNLQEKNKILEGAVKTAETEVLFSKLSTPGDDRLLLLHHQSKLKASAIEGYLNKALTEIYNNNDQSKVSELVEKALNNAKKIIAITNFATKSKFLLKTETIETDIAVFISEYLVNLASESAAQELNVHVENKVANSFSMKFKPIDIAIIFDNLASNSTRANAKNIFIYLKEESENILLVQYYDDGHGINKQIQPPEKVFNKGVTTTSGSGLGLYHVKQTIEKLKGVVSLSNEANPPHKGFSLEMRLYK
ncbi:sensor histidine kinase [Aeromonas hydrophila]|uniref:sensor histidine kinase n=1 Tax=Aeromonas TaxID=642 RepID=UPI003017558F